MFGVVVSPPQTNLAKDSIRGFLFAGMFMGGQKWKVWLLTCDINLDSHQAGHH